MEKLTITQDEFEWMGRNFKLLDFINVRTPEELQVQVPSLTLTRYKKGEKIIVEGELGGDMYILYRGALSVRRPAWLFTKEIARLSPGDFFGEVSFMVQRARTATIQAAETSDVFCFGAADMQAIYDGNPRLAAQLAALVKDRTRKLRSDNEAR